MLDDFVRDQIRSEIQQIDDLFAEFSPLLEKSISGEPDGVERAALGAVLHSFYTGLEGIFLTVVKRVDGLVPTGSSWHKDLLAQVAIGTPRRGNVISEKTKEVLQDYLAFRHFFRQAYTFILRWEDMCSLIERLALVWAQVKIDLEAFSQS